MVMKFFNFAAYLSFLGSMYSHWNTSTFLCACVVHVDVVRGNITLSTVD